MKSSEIEFTSTAELRPPLDLLTAAAGVLRQRRARWYLFGAQAVVIWGRPRMTADVDITVEIEPGEARAFVHEMEQAGFRAGSMD